MPGKETVPSLIVRPHAPLRRWGVAGALTLIGLLTLYIAYELGRYDAGYDRLAARQAVTELEVRIEHLEKANRELRTQLAELDTIRTGRAREQAEIARTIGELQSQVARQAEELEFYRKVVAQGTAELGVRIGQVRITALPQPNAFNVHLAIVRSGRADSAVTGTVALTLEAGGSTYDLAALTGGAPRELPFSFRYYQNFDQEITVPRGVQPQHLSVQVQVNGRKDVPPLAQSFLWTVEH